MFFEFLTALINLDLNWLVMLFFSNLHYLFLFAIICFFYWGPSTKKIVISMAIIIPTMWLWADFDSLSGWAIFIGSFLSIFYITKFAVLTFANDVPFLKENLIIINEIQGLGLLVFYNLFLR